MESKIRDRDIQYIIGNLLRYGVWIALSVAVLGGIIFLFNHEQETVHYDTFTEQNKTVFSLLREMFRGIFSGNGEAVILLGIMLLFLTPILRVFFSLIAFVLEKDYLYVCITLIVIGIISFSIFYGFAH